MYTMSCLTVAVLNILYELFAFPSEYYLERDAAVDRNSMYVVEVGFHWDTSSV